MVRVQVILVLVLFLALLIAVFALLNQEMVEIRFFFWVAWVSKILVILGSAFAGALAVLLAGLFRRRTRVRRAEGKPSEVKEDGKAGEKVPAGRKGARAASTPVATAPEKTADDKDA